MEESPSGDNDRKTSIAFYPSYYTTPPQQRPPSPTSFSPSPYVLNRKGRWSYPAVDAAEQLPDMAQCEEVRSEEALAAVALENSHSTRIAHGNVKENGKSQCKSSDLIEDFDMRSHASCQTGEEFYDAPEGLPEGDDSDVKARAAQLIKAGMAMSFPDEVARRIKAEESLTQLQLRWSEMVRRCWMSGEECAGQSEDDLRKYGNLDPFQILAQRLVVARLVAGSVASAAVRAEKDDEFESVLTTKNREISRLGDKLQYYEMVNRQMSQRNQEIIEASQRQKRRRQRRQKIVVGCVCAALGAGTAGLILYKLFPWEEHYRGRVSPDSVDSGGV